jgi:hypothetical protein
MYAFKTEIRGDEDLLSPGDVQHGAVIANAHDEFCLPVAGFPRAVFLRGLPPYA